MIVVYALIVVYCVGQLVCQVARGDATYQRKRKRVETERLSTRFDHFYHLPRQTLCPDLLHRAQCTVDSAQWTYQGAKMKSSDKMLAAERFTGFSFALFLAGVFLRRFCVPRPAAILRLHCSANCVHCAIKCASVHCVAGMGSFWTWTAEKLLVTAEI